MDSSGPPAWLTWSLEWAMLEWGNLIEAFMKCGVSILTYFEEVGYSPLTCLLRAATPDLFDLGKLLIESSY